MAGEGAVERKHTAEQPVESIPPKPEETPLILLSTLTHFANHKHQQEPKAACRSSEGRALQHYSHPSLRLAQRRGHRTGSTSPSITPYRKHCTILMLLSDELAVANTCPVIKYLTWFSCSPFWSLPGSWDTHLFNSRH